MKKNNLTLTQLFLIILCNIFILPLLLIACTPSGDNKNKSGLSSSIDNIQEDLTNPVFYINETDTIRIFFSEEEEKPVYMEEEDFSTLALIIAQAVYNTVWNDQDIMIKMITPDYTLVISYHNKDQDNNDFMMIWKESGKIKYQNTWYVLPEHAIQPISTILERYRNP